MYCSLHYYFDEIPKTIKNDCIVSLFDIFLVELGIGYDYISYSIWNPDKDEMLIDKKYSYDDSGISRFKNSEIMPMIKGKWGDESAAFIAAECNHKVDQLFSKIKVDLQFSTNSSPFIIKVDYEEKFAKKMNIEKYKNIISKLEYLGFKVNNSFMSNYIMKNDSVTYEGGQIGSIVGCNGRRNIKNSVAHAKGGYLNRIMDVYSINSLPHNILNMRIENEIKKIVGCNNIIETQTAFIFSMPSQKIKKAICRMRCKKVIKNTQKFQIKEWY